MFSTSMAQFEGDGAWMPWSGISSDTRATILVDGMTLDLSYLGKLKQTGTLDKKIKMNLEKRAFTKCFRYQIS